MSDTNLDTLCQSCNMEGRKVSQKLLMLSVNQLIELLVLEMEAKNEAYHFIIKKGLIAEFNDFKK